MKDKDFFIRQTVLMHGKEFFPVLLPDDIERGQVGQCFDWRALQAAKLYPKYHYVEGYATDPHNGKLIYHAWLSDGKQAYDPTWKATDLEGVEVPVPSEYYGVILPIKKVTRFMGKTGYQGVLGNHWRAPNIIKSIMEEVEGEKIYVEAR